MLSPPRIIILTALGLCSLSACRSSYPSACDQDLTSVADAASAQVRSAGASENILVIVSDDIGVDKTAVYGEHPVPARTPNIDALAAAGVRFRNAYASPTCSPSRASLLTGRLPSRTGIGRWIYAETSTVALDPAELTLPEALRHSTAVDGGSAYTSAAVGKWHVVGFDRDSPQLDPLAQGFDCYAGSLANPLESVGRGHLPRGYENWEKDVDGSLSWTQRYMSSDTTDEALARIAHTASPWFLYVAYNDAHEPLHTPPRRLRTGRLAGASDLELYEAMIEAADSEIGRLLDGIPDDVRARTTIIYLTDNGTPAHGIRAPWKSQRSKGSVYEGGVRVPLIVAGPHVTAPGSVSNALVHIVDIFPTVAEVAGVDVASLTIEEGDQAGQPLVIDGLSLMPYVQDPTLPSAREYVYAEGFYPNGPSASVARTDIQRTLRDADHKLVWHDQGDVHRERFYVLDPDSIDEGSDLLSDDPTGALLSSDDALALERLRQAMDAQVTAF